MGGGGWICVLQVISGRGLCTISFDTSRTTEDLPYMPLKEAIQRLVSRVRFVSRISSGRGFVVKEWT